MIIDRNNINEIVKITGIKPDKDYGQNFLIEPSISERITDALCATKNEKVLEIGPGLGSLTTYLVGKCDLDVCDIDIRMITFLQGEYKDAISYINDDVRKIDISKYDKIIGNLPYNITTELVTFLLTNGIKAKKMVLMCQQEACARFFDLSGKEYGPLSVLVHLLGTTKHILNAKPGSFYPAPKCNSSVFEWTFDGEIDRKTAINVYKMCKVLFLNRRKTLLNNFKNYLKNSPLANEVLVKLNISLTARPEEISPQLYLLMYNLITEMKA